MKQKLKQLAWSVSALWALLLSPEANAKVPPTKLKGVTRYFRQGKEFNSPILGAVALETGIVHDIRFYGDYESSYKANGERDWIKDKSDDPIWNLTKNLFPSPGGSLSPMTTAKSNFGRYVVKPETVSILLNLCNEVRKDPKKWSDKEIRVRKKGLNEAILNTLNIKKNKDDPDVEVDGHKAESLTPQERKALEQNINKIIDSTIESIKREEGALTPKGTTEQVIGAFFIERFSTDEHIRGLLENLDDDIVDQEMVRTFIPQEYTPDDLEQIKGKQEVYTLDDLYGLSNDSLIAGLTPYKSGVNLIAQGIAANYDRKTDTLTEVAGFTDCVEQMLRHVCNLGAWNSATHTFDLTHLKAYAAQHYPDSPYVKNLEDFFQLQKPEDANNGDFKLKSAFNRFVGDLNALDDRIHVDYNKETNELLPSFNNLIKIFQKTIGLQVDERPAGLQSQKNWVRESMVKLLSVFNPNLDYEVHTSDVSESEGDLVGDVKVEVKNKQTNEFLYRYMIKLDYRAHGQVLGFVDRYKRSPDDEYELILDHENAIHERTVEDSMRIFFPHAFYEVNLTRLDVNTDWFYFMFHEPIDNDAARKKFLVKFAADYPKMVDVKEFMLKSLRHVFESIRWDSEDSMRTLTRSILNLRQYEELKGDLQKFVTGLYHMDREDGYAVEVENVGSIALFSELKKLSVIGRTVQDLDKLNKIEEFKLVDNGENILDLSAHPLLKKLELGSVQAMDGQVRGIDQLHDLYYLVLRKVKAESLDFTGNPLLEQIQCVGVELQSGNLQGIAVLDKLKRLELRRVSYQNGQGLELNLDGLDELQTLSLAGITFEKLALGKLPVLSQLTLGGLKGLEELDLTGMPSLKSVSFENGLEDLKIIKFGEGNQITSLNGLDELLLAKPDIQVINRPVLGRNDLVNDSE